MPDTSLLSNYVNSPGRVYYLGLEAVQDARRMHLSSIVIRNCIIISGHHTSEDLMERRSYWWRWLDLLDFHWSPHLNVNSDGATLAVKRSQFDLISRFQGTEHTALRCSCIDSYWGGSAVANSYRWIMRKLSFQLCKDKQRSSSLSLMIKLEWIMVLIAEL